MARKPKDAEPVPEPKQDPTGDPHAPSEDNLKAEATQKAAKPKKGRPRKPTAEELAAEKAAQEHQHFSAFMAQQSTESLNVVMAQGDRLYQNSLDYVEKHHNLKWSFTFNDTEAKTVQNGFFELYKRTSPEFLERWGVIVTAFSLVAVVAIPRFLLARKLNEIEDFLDSDAAEGPGAREAPIDAEPVRAGTSK